MMQADAPNGFCPKGVGATGVALHLVGDLARSGSKTCACGVPDAPRWMILLPVPGRSPTSLAPTPSGQKQDYGMV
jgi:hypothetical protein